MNATALSIALFILRIGLAGFLLLWSLDKLVAPEGAMAIYQFFYHVSITTEIAYVIGAFEFLLSLAIMAGFLKTYSYGFGLLLHVTSTTASYQQLLNPFGGNHLYIAAIPVLAGFIALFLMRRQDTLWSLDAAWRK
jgi:hypothetical protein